MRVAAHWRLRVCALLARWGTPVSLAQQRLRWTETPRPRQIDVAALLRDLPISQPFDIEVFCASVAKRRNRHLRLCPAKMRGRPFGFWVPLPTEDQIWYERETSV